MTTPLGDFDTTETVYVPFNTFDSNDPSSSVTVTTLLASDCHVHKDGAIAQRTSTAGFTLSLNFDGVTGNHMLAIDLSDNTDAGFWANGSQYAVRIEGGTVDAGNINAWVGTFTIGRTLRPASAGDTGADLVGDVWDEVLTGGTHNVTNSAGRRLRQLQEAGTYAGAIWIDTVNGTAGTTDFENGTDSNPVDTIADADTLAASLGISRFMVAPGSSITLAASQQNQVFMGSSWTLALGGQNIDGTSICGANVTGIATNTAGTQYFTDCNVGAVTLPGDTHLIACAISGTHTVGESGDYFWSDCHSAVAGSATPTLDINSLANVNINWRAYSGGIAVANAVATTTMSYEADGQIVINATCTSLTVTIRGNCSRTDNGVGTVITEDARFSTGQNIGIDWSNVSNPGTTVDLSATDINLVDTTTTNTDMRGTDSAALATALADVSADIAAVKVDTGTTIPARFDGVEGATFNTATDSLEAIRNRGDAAWATGVGGTGLTALASGTAQGGTASTIQLAAGHAFADDVLNGNVVNILSGTGAGQSRVIKDYTGATDTATVSPAWTTSPDATSTYEVVQGSSNLATINLAGVIGDGNATPWDGE